LDPWWYDNRVHPQDLPLTPADLQAALHVITGTPDLITHYYVGDELILNGPKIGYRVNDALAINFCLNNPGMLVSTTDSCHTRFMYTAPNGSVEWVEAVEKDLYERNNQLTSVVPGLSQRRSSGTILVASKVSISAAVQTGGYDLVIVANDVVFERGGEILTTPPPRPDGIQSFDDHPGYYDYGYSQPGYRAGDVLILAKNVEGQIRIHTGGGKGQRAPRDFAVDYAPFVPSVAWETRYTRVTGSAQAVSALPSGWQFFSSQSVFDLGDQGRGGAGGEPGNVTIISTDGDEFSEHIRQSGGDGADTVSSQLPAQALDANGTAVDLAAFFHGGAPTLPKPTLGPGPWACPASFLLGVTVAVMGTRPCQASQPVPHASCDMGLLLGTDKFSCWHGHSQINNVARVAYTPVVHTPDFGGPAFGFWAADFRMPEDIALPLDYNGDRRDDLLFYRPGLGGAALLQSKGDGTFSVTANNPGSPLIPGPGFASVSLDRPEDRFVATDYDGDGDDDLFFYRPGSGAVSLLKSEGNGRFTALLVVAGTPTTPGSGVAGFDFANAADLVLSLDYDGDGRDELLFYRPGTSVVWLVRSDGAHGYEKVFGGTQPAGSTGAGLHNVGLASAATRIVALDFDDDYDDDLFIYTPGTGAVALAQSDGDGAFNAVFNFRASSSALGPGLGGFSFATVEDRALVLDFNRDHKSDLFMYRPGAGAAAGLLSNGDATWSTVFNIGGSVTKQGPGLAGFTLWRTEDRVVALDYNGDGHGDLLFYRPVYGHVTLASLEGAWTAPALLDVAFENRGPEAPTNCSALGCTCPTDYAINSGRCFLNLPPPLPPPSENLARNEAGMIIRPQWPGRLVGKSGRYGPHTAQYQRFYVNAPVNLLAYSAGAASYVTDGSTVTGHCPGGHCLSPLAFAQIHAALAPRAAELMSLKGDMLFRSLSDDQLLENDATYQANSAVNPLHINRLDKARYYYAAAAYYCVDQILSHAASSSNPMWPDCQYSLAQKRRLENGLNYLGFDPGFFVYAKPHLVHQYFLAFRDYLLLRRGDFLQAVTNLDNAAQNQVDAGLNAQIRVFEHAKAVAALAAADEQAKATSLVLDNALQRVDETSIQIRETQDEIAAALDRIEELTQPPPCDELCWAGRVFNIAVAVINIVSAVYSFNWAALGASLQNAITMLQTAATVIEGIKAVGDYANLLINGKTGEVKWETDVNGLSISVGTDDAFKKGVIDRAKTIYDNANRLIEAADEIVADGKNPLAAQIAKIRTSALTMGSNLQDNLTQIYQMQGALEAGGNTAALAEARSLEDRTKYIQGLDREIPDQQRRHVEAAAEMVVASLNRQVSVAHIAQATRAQELQDRLVARYTNAVANGEAMVDASCRAARLVSDLTLMLQYLYDRSVAYLRLETASPSDFKRTALLQSDFDAMTLRDVTIILNDFVDHVLKPEQQPGVITDIIAPVEYAVSVNVDASGSTYQFPRRSRPQVADAICPGGGSCSLTRAAYQEEVVQALRVSGIADFQFIPTSDTRFRALPAASQAAWNVGLHNVDQTEIKTRVLDVSARILLENWNLPTVTAVSTITLSHRADAEFVMDDNGMTRTFSLRSEPMRTACVAIGNIMGSDPGCQSITFFERRVTAPFTEISTTYQDLSSVTVTSFQNASMFGTSLHGTWTIDLRDVVNQLNTFQAGNPTYNGCTASAPCTAVESFWQKFRGIELKVFWVPTP
jgi:hypothetical protein